MFEGTREEIRKTPEFKADMKALIEKRLYERLPNNYLIIMEILKEDKNSPKLQETIRKHMEELTSHRKVTLESQESNQDILIMHMFDSQGVDSSTTTLSPVSGDVATDYQLERETFEALKEHAVDFNVERAFIEKQMSNKIV